MLRKYWQLMMVVWTSLCGASYAVPIPIFPTLAKQAIMIDLSTQTILFEKNPDQAMFPSSMLKILTTYVVFDRVKQGTIAWDQSIMISQKAWAMGGSKMFVKVGSSVKLSDLVQGIITLSGNDACIAIAEAIAGSEEAFAQIMNETAKNLGATHTNCTNASGWPDPKQITTSRDLAIISTRLIQDFPEYYKMYSVNQMTHNGITQSNRNPLLGRFPGADGIKTGHTDSAGYGLVGSAQQGKRRILLVANGYASQKDRFTDTHGMMDWAFKVFDTYILSPAKSFTDETLSQDTSPIMAFADVWVGDQPRVGLAPKTPIAITIPKAMEKSIQAELVYKGPIPAPIQQGDRLATLILSADGMKPLEFPLYAAHGVNRANIFKRIPIALHYLLYGKNP